MMISSKERRVACVRTFCRNTLSVFSSKFDCVSRSESSSCKDLESRPGGSRESCCLPCLPSTSPHSHARPFTALYHSCEDVLRIQTLASELSRSFFFLERRRSRTPPQGTHPLAIAAPAMPPPPPPPPRAGATLPFGGILFPRVGGARRPRERRSTCSLPDARTKNAFGSLGRSRPRCFGSRHSGTPFFVVIWRASPEAEGRLTWTVELLSTPGACSAFHPPLSLSTVYHGFPFRCHLRRRHCRHRHRCRLFRFRRRRRRRRRIRCGRERGAGALSRPRRHRRRT